MATGRVGKSPARPDPARRARSRRSSTGLGTDPASGRRCPAVSSQHILQGGGQHADQPRPVGQDGARPGPPGGAPPGAAQAGPRRLHPGAARRRGRAAEIPIHLTGEPAGVRDGGLLEQGTFTLSIEAKPGDIPPAIEVDVRALESATSSQWPTCRCPPASSPRRNPETSWPTCPAPRHRSPEEAEAAEGEEARARRPRARAARPPPRPARARPPRRRGGVATRGGAATRGEGARCSGAAPGRGPSADLLVVGLGNPGDGVRPDPPQRRRRGRRAPGQPPRRQAPKQKERSLTDEVNVGGKRIALADPPDLHERLRGGGGSAGAALRGRARPAGRRAGRDGLRARAACR